MPAVLRDMDPRRSLVAAIIWLVVALAASFAIAASLWAGSVARDIVVQQHVRRLALETDQLGSDLGQAVGARLNALRTTDGSAPTALRFENLVAAFPHLGWIALADAAGKVVAVNGRVSPDASLVIGSVVTRKPWFAQAQQRPWIGRIEETQGSSPAPLLGDLAVPLKDQSGRVVGVIAAHLNWHWASNDVVRLSDTLDPDGSAQTLVLNRAGVVVVGPAELRDQQWSGSVLADPTPGIDTSPLGSSMAPRFERLRDGRTVLVARAPIGIDGEQPAHDWQVQLSEPRENVYRRANALAGRILWISVILGAVTALLGALGARHLTNRLKRLTRSAGAVGRNEIARIEVPSGCDEVAQLGGAFAKVLDDLRQERSELLALSSDLERRVAVRTREVQRLAEESRYAAIVRERLKIARDLHDTLAHSMMAMLSEIRLLRKIQVHDPQSLPDELAPRRRSGSPRLE